MMTATPATPLSPLMARLLPFLLLFIRGRGGETLRLRAKLTKEIQEKRRNRKTVGGLLEKEARVYEALLVAALTRLGEAYLPRFDHEAASGSSRKKVQRVHFERICTSTELIFYKILVSRKTMFGLKNVLPYRVRVFDLIKDETLLELSYACERVVTAKADDPRKGAWIIVHRLEGVGGLPPFVNFKDIIKHYPGDSSKGTLMLGIGEHRKTETANLDDMPHVLVGGASGGGKSNFVNNIILTLMLFTDHKELKFVLIDLKRLEFSLYKDAPHLYKPVVTDDESAIETLKELYREVMRRNQIMEGKAKNLSTWNKRNPKQAMPRIVCIIDEFSELMLASGRQVAKESANLVTRISNLGRACGVHLIICTQRPAVEVVGNAIKVNMALTISARTQNKHQSGVILGNGAAADLPMIPGRMLALAGSSMYALQTPYIGDDDVSWALAIVRGKAAGVIRLYGTEPVIEPEGLARYIVASGGSLKEADIKDRLPGLGVELRAYRAWVSELVKVGGSFIDGNAYRVLKTKEGYRLAGVDQPEKVNVDVAPAAPPTRQAAASDWQPAGYLPDRKPYGYLAANIAGPALPPPPPELPKEKDVNFARFIEACCVFGPRCKVKFGELYGIYLAWCEEIGEMEVNQATAGGWLQQHNFDRKRGTGGYVVYVGLDLVEALKAKPVKQMKRTS